jgi:Domain of unknown function (DUF4384)
MVFSKKAMAGLRGCDIGLKRLLLGACFVFLAGAQEPAKPQLTARELFYAAVRTPAAPPLARPVAPKAAPPKEAQSGASAAAPSRPEPARPPQPTSEAATISTASLVPSPAEPPLGLKYTILKRAGEDMIEVPADSVFHAGDRIRISVETNQPGFLYIINRGSSGLWQPLFPSADVDDGSNRVEGFRDYLLPPKSRMVFDETTGTERLFLVFSRQPEANLDRMIYSLTSNPAPGPDQRQAPVTKTLLVASNSGVDDSTVGLLRSVNSRDLKIEKVDERTPGEKKETAVYVVNPSGSADSRVVADLLLAHQ